MRTFGTYTDLVEIGRGGMATVYRATAPDGGLVALKVLAVHLAADPTARVRFEQESNLGLDHPNVVRVHKAGVEGETPFIEMDYVAGQSLDRLIARQGPLTPRALDPILTDAAAALDYAHDRGVVHRDVKPSNILVRRDGRSLLADFGVAKAADATAFTATHARVGSVFFMSPEQATGSFEITKASDIYSLGITIYYALTGHLPFEGDNEIAIARQHAERAPRHISDAHPSVPRPVGDVIMRALEKAPGRRPATAGEFAREYARALDAPEIPPPLVIAAVPAAAATTPTPAATVATPPTRRIGLPGVVVLIVLMALCLAGLAAAIAAPAVLTPATATPTPTRAAPELTISTATPLPESSGSVLIPLGPTPTSGLITPLPPVNVLPTLPPFPTPFPLPTVAPLPIPTMPAIPTAPTFPTLPPPPAPTPTFVIPTPSPPTVPPPSPTPTTPPPPTVPPPSPTPTTPPPTVPPPSPTPTTPPPPTVPPPSPTPTTPPTPTPPPPTPPIIVTVALLPTQ